MFDWIFKLIGKNVASKLKLEDNNMAYTSTIAWYKSRAIWTAIVTVIIGAVGPISTAFGHPVVIPPWILSLLTGVGIYTTRTATTDIK